MLKPTSMEARARLVTSGLLSDRQFLAWLTLDAKGPMTAQEIDKAAKTRGLWKRLSELRSLGLAVELPARPCRITKRLAVVWQATQPNGYPKPKKKPREFFAVMESPSFGFIARNREALGIEAKKGLAVFSVREVLRKK